MSFFMPFVMRCWGLQLSVISVVHYPNTDPRFKDISSLKLLSMVKDLLITSGYQVINIDSTVVLEAPKIASFIPSMRQNISESLSLPVTQVSVKATTNEGLGPMGRGEGCAAFAVASLRLLDPE